MNYLEEIDRLHPVRRSREEKEKFRTYAKECFTSMGADARCEASKNGKHKNLIVGDIDSADVLLVAHYDTPAASPFPNLMLPRSPVLFWIYQFVPLIILVAVSLLAGYLASLLAENSRDVVFYFGFLAVYYVLYFLFFRTFKNRHNKNDNTSGIATVMTVCARLSDTERKKCAFVLFDNEEKGKLGSKALFAEQKESLSHKPVLNFDCVGNGENIIFIAKPDAEKSPLYPALKSAFSNTDAYSVNFFPQKGSEANSDHKSFPLGIGCIASKKTRRGIFYTPRIHTARDVVASEENVEYIANGITSFIKTLNCDK